MMLLETRPIADPQMLMFLTLVVPNLSKGVTYMYVSLHG